MLFRSVKPEEPKPEKPKPEKKSLLGGLVIKQAGKEIKGAPQSDNYTVTFAKKEDDRDPRKIVEALTTAYPGCVFTWVSK